jgi:putative SOS response-associated peptidase YedK
MCGRYVQVSSPELLAERFHVTEAAVDGRDADYNVAPRKTVPVVVQRAADRRVLEEMRWGLVPSWARDRTIGDRLINARAEGLAAKASYKGPFRRRRCIIPADAFYEWRVVPGQKRKQPVLLRARDGEPLAFGGLWDTWRDPDDPGSPWLVTCVIITTEANDTVRPIHDRMPALLAEADWDRWLDPRITDPAEVAPLLVPAPPDVLTAVDVSTRVNDVRNNGPELVAPLA